MACFLLYLSTLKQFCRITIAYILLVSILLLSTGIPVYGHTCLVSKQVKVSVLPVKGCFGTPPPTGAHTFYLKKGTCCAYSNALLKADFSLRKTVTAQASPPQPLLLFVLPALLIQQPLTLEQPAIQAGDSSPPEPLAGRDLLASIRILRI